VLDVVRRSPRRDGFAGDDAKFIDEERGKLVRQVGLWGAEVVPPCVPRCFLATASGFVTGALARGAGRVVSAVVGPVSSDDAPLVLPPSSSATVGSIGVRLAVRLRSGTKPSECDRPSGIPELCVAGSGDGDEADVGPAPPSDGRTGVPALVGGLAGHPCGQEETVLPVSAVAGGRVVPVGGVDSGPTGAVATAVTLAVLAARESREGRITAGFVLRRWPRAPGFSVELEGLGWWLGVLRVVPRVLLVLLLLSLPLLVMLLLLRDRLFLPLALWGSS
jgi:hypothetical protein